MANIQTYLQRIMSAIYGREVRSSIHDAIEAINNEVVAAHDEMDDFVQGDLDTTLTSTTLPAQGKAVGDAIANYRVPVDTTLTHTGEAAEAKATGDTIQSVFDAVADVKDSFGDYLGVEPIKFINGYYIATNKSVGAQIDLTPLEGADANNYAIVDAKEGDIFTITGTGGSTGRLWAFVDSENKLLSVSAASASLKYCGIVGPKYSSKLILHQVNTVKPCFKNNLNIANISDFDDINYGYDSPYYREPVDGVDNTNVFGIRRIGRSITVTNNTSISTYGRIRLTGTVASIKGSNSSINSYNTGVKLVAGHRYRVILVKKSGEIISDDDIPVVVSVYKIGTSSTVGTMTKVCDYTVIRDFVAEDTLYNLFLYINAYTILNNVEFLIILKDLSLSNDVFPSDRAQKFDSANSYSVGEYVEYDGSDYMFSEEHNPGAWNSDHVKEVNNILDEVGQYITWEECATLGTEMMYPESGTYKSNSNTRICYTTCIPGCVYLVHKNPGRRFSITFSTEIPAVGVSYISGCTVTDNTANAITTKAPAEAKYIVAYVWNTGAGDTGDVEDMLASVKFYYSSVRDAELPAIRETLDDTIRELGTKSEAVIGSVSGSDVLSSPSGSIVTITDHASDQPLLGCTVDILPVQSGSGDPSPDNIRPITGWTTAAIRRSPRFLSWVMENGSISDEGVEATTSGYRRSNYIDILDAKNVNINFYAPSGGWVFRIVGYNENEEFETLVCKTTYSTTATRDLVYDIPENVRYIRIVVKSTVKINRLCTDYSYFEIAFPTEAGTVYGGTLDVTNGVLTVTKENIGSYAGESLPGVWISDRDIYTEGGIPTAGAQVVYDLAEPVIYQLTPTEIRTLLGETNFFTDAGNLSIEYQKDIVQYIGREINTAIDNASAFKAPAVEKSVSGDIASFLDGAEDMPVKSLIIDIEPTQSGTGDPSPDNVRPISGWTGVNITRTNANLACGDALKDIIFNNVSTNARGEDIEGWVWFLPQANVYPTIWGSSSSDWRTKAVPKERTPYTIWFNASTNAETDSTNLNIGVTYTDETYTIFKKSDIVDGKIYFVTDSTKTLKNVWIGRNAGYWTSFYYPTFCICEGVVAKEDISAQAYDFYNISLPSEAGMVYGGTLDVTNGVLTVDRITRTFDGSENWISAMNDTSELTNYWRTVIGAYGSVPIPSEILCDKYGYAAISTSNTITGINCVNSNSYNVAQVMLRDNSRFTTANELKTWLQTNGLTVSWKITTPITYQLTPIEVRTLLGENHIFADTGMINFCEYRVDTASYIDSKIDENIDDTLTISGKAAEVKAVNDVLGKKSDSIVNFTEGPMVHFDDGGDDLSVKSITVELRPVQNGSGIPSSSNVREIEPIRTFDITVTGRNIFDKSNVHMLAAYFDETKIISSSGQRTIYIPCEPNTSYTVQKIAVNSGSGDRLAIAWTKAVPAVGVSTYGYYFKGANFVIGEKYSFTTTTGPDAKYLVVWISRQTEYADSLTTTQIEVGANSVHDYEPYKSATYTIALPESLGDVYGGRITINDDGTGVLERSWVKQVYDGSGYSVTSMGAVDSGDGSIIHYESALSGSDIGIYNAGSDSTVVADKLESGSSYNVGNVYIKTNGTGIGFTFEDQNVTSVTAANTYLQSNPITVAYKFATPTSVEFKIDNLNMPRTFYGINNVFDAESVEYRANPGIVIQNTKDSIESELQNAVDNLQTTRTQIVLTSDAWNNYMKQTEIVDGVSGNETEQIIEVIPAKSSEDEYARSMVRAILQGPNTLTFECEYIPSTDLVVYVMIRKVVSAT